MKGSASTSMPVCSISFDCSEVEVSPMILPFMIADRPAPVVKISVSRVLAQDLLSRKPPDVPARSAAGQRQPGKMCPQLGNAVPLREEVTKISG